MALPEAGVMGFSRQPGGPWSLLSAPAVEGRHILLPFGSHCPHTGQGLVICRAAGTETLWNAEV